MFGEYLIVIMFSEFIIIIIIVGSFHLSFKKNSGYLSQPSQPSISILMLFVLDFQLISSFHLVPYLH